MESRLVRIALLAWFASLPSLAIAVPVGNPPTSFTGVGNASVITAEIDSTETVTSDPIDLRRAAFFGISGDCDGADPDVDIQWQSSNTNTSGDFVTTVTAADGVTGVITPAGFSPPPSAYGRIALVGNAGNGADTECTIYIFIQGSY